MSYTAKTITGDEVQIVEKRSDATREVLVADDGAEYVLDYGQGLLIPTADAPIQPSAITMETEEVKTKDPESDPSGEVIEEPPAA